MSNSFVRSPGAAIDALLAVVTIPLHLLLSKIRSEQFAVVLLAAIGAIYMGFRLQKGIRAQIATELTVATGFFAAALVGLWVTPWIVPVAFRAWYLGLCAPPGFKARIHILKAQARLYTLMVSSILCLRRLDRRGILGSYVEPAGLNGQA